MKMRLPKPRSGTTAGQCRQMGVKVGDTIIGRETYSNGLWSEAKLTLLFAGKEAAVWKVMRRKSDAPRWRSTGEETCWTLEHREWWLVMHNVEVQRDSGSIIAGVSAGTTGSAAGDDK